MPTVPNLHPNRGKPRWDCNRSLATKIPSSRYRVFSTRRRLCQCKKAIRRGVANACKSRIARIVPAVAKIFFLCPIVKAVKLGMMDFPFDLSHQSWQLLSSPLHGAAKFATDHARQVLEVLDLASHALNRDRDGNMHRRRSSGRSSPSCSKSSSW